MRCGQPLTSRRVATVLAWAGASLALLIGVSRLALGAHSLSEVILGLAVGALVSCVVLARWPVGRLGLRIGVVVLAFLLSTMASAIPSRPSCGRMTWSSRSP